MGRLVVDVGCDELAVACALGVGAPPMDLEIRVWVLAGQYGSTAGGAVLLDVGVEVGALCSGYLGGEIGLRVGRCEVRLALLEVLNLARRVLRAHEAAVETSDLVALCQPLAGPFAAGMLAMGIAEGAHLGGSVAVVELLESAANVRVGASNIIVSIVGEGGGGWLTVVPFSFRCR